MILAQRLLNKRKKIGLPSNPCARCGASLDGAKNVYIYNGEKVCEKCNKDLSEMQ